MKPPAKLETVLYNELSLETHWALGAWADLRQTVVSSREELIANPYESALKLWPTVDRFLVHVTRAARILYPNRRDLERYLDRISVQALVDFSEAAKVRLGSQVFDTRDVRKARNIVEHLVERIPKYWRENESTNLTQLAMGLGSLPKSDGEHNVLRSFDPESGLCEVLGLQINLVSIVSELQKLRMRIPDLRLNLESHYTDGLESTHG